jgi:hypothetical protein
MRLRGVNYDAWIYPFGEARPSRPQFEPAIVRRELEIVRTDLHCNAVRIVGRDIGRLATAARFALEQGLEVWFSPAFHDADEARTLAHLVECASAAEELRQTWPNVVFVAGWELTFLMRGLVLGRTSHERMSAFMKPWRLLWSTAGVWEDVDWARFDFVSVDCYRDGRNANMFRENLRKYFSHGKPVVITEFGCCTYAGAEEKGAYGWAIVDWNHEPPQRAERYQKAG